MKSPICRRHRDRKTRTDILETLSLGLYCMASERCILTYHIFGVRVWHSVKQCLGLARSKMKRSSAREYGGVRSPLQSCKRKRKSKSKLVVKK